MLTLIEVAGSTLVAFLYIAILATAVGMKSRRNKPPVAKPEPPDPKTQRRALDLMQFLKPRT